LEEYLRDLEVVVAIKEADEFSVPRITQLTQKTNQLNMTTRRYTESQIESFISAPRSSVFYVSVKDRLGDHGIVGVIILRIDGGQCLIDTFLLSCRVLGLTIEETMIAFIKARAKSAGCKKLIGEYIPTRKNKPAEGVYERAHFEKQDDAYFIFDLNKKNDKFSTFVKPEPLILNKESLVK
jgi:FkbH-like protein